MEPTVPRHTKIIATLGPATDDKTTLEELLRAGLDVVRLNFSHGSGEDHLNRARLVREASAATGRDVAILADLQGPKIRIAGFRNGPIQLAEGAAFMLDTSLGTAKGTEAGVGVTYPELIGDIGEGDTLLLDDGRIALRVEKLQAPRILCRVTVGGELSDNKGLNRQGGGLSAAALTDKDKRDIETIGQMQPDYVAISFPRSGEDMTQARELLRGAGSEAALVAKIERREAVDNIGEIIAASDAVMVARGDLAVEIGDAELPGVQKRLIRRARAHNRAAITATKMMESMRKSTIPTRAEVMDVANAVLDGTDAVMLSAESATGDYPVKAVEAMARVCVGSEKHDLARYAAELRDGPFERIEEAVARAAVYTAQRLSVSAIAALTESGNTALLMSRAHLGLPIFALTRHPSTRRRVALYSGVYPVAFEMRHNNPEHVLRDAVARLRELDAVAAGDLLIATQGDVTGQEGGTNGLKIVTA